MSNNLNKEHSYLCLVTIYVIHVILFHVYSPEAASTIANVNINNEIGPAMDRWKKTPAIIERSENFSSLFADDGVVRTDTTDDNDDTLIEKNSINRNVRGVEPTVGQFSHQVSLRRSGIHFCGGNIIDEEWIVTAAHCMYSDNEPVDASTVTIYAGDPSLNKISSTSQIKKVQTVIIHEDFNLGTSFNDIALLKLGSKLNLNNVTVASRGMRNVTVEDGTLCQVFGWGARRHGETVSNNELLYVNVKIINRTSCQQLMVNYSNIPQFMICAGYIEGGFDSCQNDHGGGLICDDLLTGLLTSRGKECGLEKFSGLYTNLNVFKDWIIEKIATNSSYSNIISNDYLTPAVWGVFLGCIVFFFTSTDHDKYEM